MSAIASLETIEKRIFQLRGKKVMLDHDLAMLYSVEAKILNQAVKRNSSRFPDDFMFRLTLSEYRSMRSSDIPLQQGTYAKYAPFAFTEHGILMLSSVLNSPRAVQANIQIMRAFIRLREMVTANADFRRALENLERRVDVHDRQIGAALDAVKKLLDPPERKSPGRKMGFAD